MQSKKAEYIENITALNNLIPQITSENIKEEAENYLLALAELTAKSDSNDISMEEWEALIKRGQTLQTRLLHHLEFTNIITKINQLLSAEMTKLALIQTYHQVELLANNCRHLNNLHDIVSYHANDNDTENSIELKIHQIDKLTNDFHQIKNQFDILTQKVHTLDIQDTNSHDNKKLFHIVKKTLFSIGEKYKPLTYEKNSDFIQLLEKNKIELSDRKNQLIKIDAPDNREVFQNINGKTFRDIKRWITKDNQQYKNLLAHKEVTTDTKNHALTLFMDKLENTKNLDQLLRLISNKYINKFLSSEDQKKDELAKLNRNVRKNSSSILKTSHKKNKVAALFFNDTSVYQSKVDKFLSLLEKELLKELQNKHITVETPDIKFNMKNN